jgi:hypothetical protein
MPAKMPARHDLTMLHYALQPVAGIVWLSDGDGGNASLLKLNGGLCKEHSRLASGCAYFEHHGKNITRRSSA